MKTIKNRNTNGRPVKQPSEKKSYKITVKMATEEYYSLKAKAGLAGVNRSEFIRICIRAALIKQRLTPEMMGHNVNQIARSANTVGYFEVHNHCHVVIESLDKVIKRIEDDS